MGPKRVCAKAAPKAARGKPKGKTQAGTHTKSEACYKNRSDSHLLKSTADEFAKSLYEGSVLATSFAPFQDLRDALLIENADRNPEAAECCRAIRSAFVGELRDALSARGDRAARLLAAGPISGTARKGSTPRGACESVVSPGPKIRLEVRETAGRTIVSEAFTVGRNAACDVQTCCDDTVSRLQLLVVSVPGAIVIIDAWSSGGTRTVKRSGPTTALPASLPPAGRVVFAIPHGERVTLLIGKKTTITLGPATHEPTKTPLPDDLASPCGARAATVAAARIAEPLSEPPRFAAAPPTATTLQDLPSAASSNSEMAGSSTVSTIQAPRPTIAAREAPAVAVAAAAAATPVTVSTGAVEPAAMTTPVGTAAQEAVLSAATASQSSAMEDVAPDRSRAAARWTRCLAGVRATVRLKRMHEDRERLRWRCSAARRANLVTDDQAADLLERLRGVAATDASEEVRDILDGLGVPPAPDDASHVGATIWKCTVCDEIQHVRGWRCPFSHRYCRECMLRWAEARALPTCPNEGCGYQLGEHDLEDLRVGNERTEAFRNARIEQGLAALQHAESQTTVFRCPGIGCGAAVVLSLGEARRRWTCVCGAPPACTACGSSPYHYHAKCADVQSLRARWLAWLQGGREAYKGLTRRAAREANAQQRALHEAMARHADLERDEQWKADRCRVCPECRNVVEKLDGCNTIVCGQNAHGGNRQPGCGHKFSWKDARPYTQRVGLARLPEPVRAKAVSGRGVRHLFAQCNLCVSAHRCIVGPRFRCINCPSFSCCLKCEERLAREHEEGHVFEIMFEDEVDWSRSGVVLSNGTRARIRCRASDVAHEDVANSPRPKRRRDVGLEGVVRGQRGGRYVLDLGDGEGNRHVEPSDLQPLLTQKQAERLLETMPSLSTITPPTQAAGAQAASSGAASVAAVVSQAR